MTKYTFPIYRIVCSIVCCLVLMPDVLAYDNPDLFKSLVLNCPPSQYKGDSQIWSIEQDGKGFVYYASGTKLVVFDGINTESYEVDEERVIRHLKYDEESGRLYCAGDYFFGYWTRDTRGVLGFTMLYRGDPEVREDIFWRVFPKGNILYLSTHQRFISYDISTGEMHEWISGDIGYLFDVDGEFLVQVDDKLMKFDGENFSVCKSGLTDRVVYVENRNGEYFLIGEDSVIPSQSVFSVYKQKSGNYLLGTIADGVYVMSPSGEIVRKFNANDGLDYTTVLSLAETEIGDIVIGGDGGVTWIINNRQLSYYKDLDMKIGAVYTALVWNSKLYMGTNKGLLRESDRPDDGSDFVPGIRGQVWDMLVYKNRMFLVKNEGLYMLEKSGNITELAANVTSVKRLYHRSNILCASDDKGLLMVDMDVDSGQIVSKIWRVSDYSASNQTVKFDKYGNIWLDFKKGHTVRLKPGEYFKKIIDTKKYKVGDRPDNLVRIFEVDGELIFTSGKTCFVYNPNSDAIEYSSYYTTLFANFVSSNLNITQIGNRFFNYGEDGTVDMLIRHGNDVYMTTNVFRSNNLESIPKRYARVIALDKNTAACGYFETLCKYNFDVPGRVLPKVNIYRLAYSNGRSTSFADLSSSVELPHHVYDLKFYISLTGGESLEYRLDNQNWTGVPKGDPISFKFLDVGSHKLDIKFRDQIIKTINFKIKPHPMLEWWGILYMFLALSAVILIIRQVYLYRIKRIKEKFEAQRKADLERETIQHQNEILAMEVKERDKKLTIQTLNNLFVNESLATIIDSLSPKVAFDGTVNFEDVKKCVQKQYREDGTWSQFDIYFNNIFDGFLDRLKTRYPNLTGNDIKYCAFIRMGLSTKEIASMLNIKLSSAESARYRLRKNMDLGPDDSLSEIISKI